MKRIGEEAKGSLARRGGAWGRWLRPVLLAMLLVAAVLLWRRASVPEAGSNALSQPTHPPAVTVAPEPLSARQQREAAYEKDLAALQALLQKQEIREETRQQAAAQLSRMVEEHRTELGLEQALAAAGFSPCFVLVQNNALTVAVSAAEITPEESAVILSVCLAHANVPPENIRIMPGALQGCSWAAASACCPACTALRSAASRRC